MAVAELEIEAVAWEANVAGGQLTLAGIVALSCIGLSVLVTYLVEEVRHEHADHRNDEER